HSMLLRFFHDVPQIGWIRATAHLASENWCRVRGNEFVAFQHELRIDPIARGLIDFVAAEITVEFVFVIVVATELETFAVRRKFLFFIKHHQLCCAPWLTRATDVAPELVIGFVVTSPDVIIAGRRFGCDPLRHLDSRLLDALRNSFASGEEQSAQHEITRQQIESGASHPFNGHLLRSFAPGAIATSRQHRPAISFSCEIDCIATSGSLEFRRIMFEVEIYARGLREMGKILELDRHILEITGLRYKLDTNHDIVYLEFDEPTLSIREIRTIFLRLGLEPLFVGAIPPELQSRPKTERLGA